MIKIFMNSGPDLIIRLKDDLEELKFICDWNNGILSRKISIEERILKLEDINNLQYLQEDKKDYKPSKGELRSYAKSMGFSDDVINRALEFLEKSGKI